METSDELTSLKLLELRIVSTGLILAGLAIIVTGVSYLINMKFTYQWLVWVIGIAFILVGILTVIWPLGFRRPAGRVPEGKFRQFLILSIPIVFIMSSQVCGIGLRACNTVCHITNLFLIGLAAIIAFRLYRGQPIAALLFPVVVIGLIPHCVCHAPINSVWHSLLGGVSPTCEMMPLAASFFSVIALRGVRSQISTALVAVIFVVMIFIIVGGLLFGFPWQGCVDHPMITSMQ